MVIGTFVKCKICGDEKRLRYNVGNKFPQSATFPCKKCGENLTYGFSKDKEKTLINIIGIPDNFDLPVVNLHPELPIDPESATDPYYFPSLDLLRQQMQKGNSGFIELRKAQFSVLSYQKEWTDIKHAFRFLVEERWEMLEKEYGKQKDKIEKKVLKKIVTAGCFFLEGKWKSLYRTVLAEAEKAKRHTSFSNLKSFVEENKHDFLLEKMYALMVEYNRVEGELLPALLNQKIGHDQSGLSSSVNWQKIEKVYGDFYEIYGDLLVIPTAINNLLQRGEFDEFATEGFTMDKYVDSDKANRCKNFMLNPNLEPLSHFYDAGIRNGTHHKASKFQIINQEIILKTGKGGRTERRIPLIEYAVYCNEIYARCLILLNITFKLAY